MTYIITGKGMGLKPCYVLFCCHMEKHLMFIYQSVVEEFKPAATYSKTDWSNYECQPFSSVSLPDLPTSIFCAIDFPIKILLLIVLHQIYIHRLQMYIPCWLIVRVVTHMLTKLPLLKQVFLKTINFPHFILVLVHH